MTVIGFLTYADFISELNHEVQPKPLRLQSYTQIQTQKNSPIREYTFIVQLSAENLDGDILICRFITAIKQFVGVERDQLTYLTQCNNKAADMLRVDLIGLNYQVDTGLVQLNEDVTIQTTWPDCWNNLRPEANGR